MPGFADSFWSSDYAGGLGVLFGKLQQGVVENYQILTIARMRAEAEELYGRKLGEIAPTTDRSTAGFARDDGASLKKAFEGVRGEMEEASKNHKKIAANIGELVITPFSRWCDAHETRVQNSQDDLQARVKAHDRQAEAVRKLRSAYFNKCRQVEDLEEENKLAFQDPDKLEGPGSPKSFPTPTIKLPEAEDVIAEEPIEMGDETFTAEQVKQALTHMLNTIKIGETKVPILGTYQNVSSGADIVEFLQKEMSATTVSYAERIGQDLIQHGYLRLVGNVGNVFANSSKMFYQWRPKAFQITGIPERKRALERISSSGSNLDSPTVGSVGDMLAVWNPLNNQHPNETPMERLQREAKESDEKYKSGVQKLDLIRCNLEEAIINHLRFMERCELDRLKAVKAVMLDFSGALSNVIPSLQSTVDNMMLYQETVQPLGDLRYFLENYRTGGFAPKVQVYDNYYNNVDEQTFGVDLEARARSDKKRVPIIVTTILTFLDNHYPDLEGDEARRSIWTIDVPLAATHHLRNAINTGKAVPREVLDRYEIPIVASVLKLYLLELPDSLVSSQVYEIIKTIYSSPDSSASSKTRVSVIQSTLGQLRLANIATLDAITTHFTRLIELTSADEPFVTSLAQTLAPCILRPKTESSLTMHERHSYRLLRDLFDHKEAIFGALKRASAMSHGPNGLDHRPRAPSGADESNRRANMEARTRAIVQKARASSPAPSGHGVGGRGHRRDRSIGGAESRFPIVTSPTTTVHPPRGSRQSLGVPTEPDAAQPTEPPYQTSANGSSSRPLSESSTVNDISDQSRPNSLPHISSMLHDESNVDIQNRDSLGRTAAVSRLNRGAPGTGSGSGIERFARQGEQRDSSGSMSDHGKGGNEGDRPQGVQLTDKPMDLE